MAEVDDYQVFSELDDDDLYSLSGTDNTSQQLGEDPTSGFHRFGNVEVVFQPTTQTVGARSIQFSMNTLLMNLSRVAFHRPVM